MAFDGLIDRKKLLEVMDAHANKLAGMKVDSDNHYSIDTFDVIKLSGYEEAIDHVEDAPAVCINGDTSDGYHTFNELYHHRAVLFSVIVKNYPDRCWKSKKHHDGTMYDGMFIVGINTQDGQATYHYDIEPYWDMFECKEIDSAPEWDGHTPDEAIDRIGNMKHRAEEPVRHGRWVDRPESYKLTLKSMPDDIVCSSCLACFDMVDNDVERFNFCPNCGAKMGGGVNDG